MSSANTDFLSQLIATFRLEADEHLQAMITEMLALEKASTPEEQTPIVETIFREAHSLKGAARAVDLTEIEAVCQALEGVFARLKRLELHLVPEDFDTIHRALDTVTKLLTDPDEPHATLVAEAVQGLAHLEADDLHDTSQMRMVGETVSTGEDTSLQASVIPSLPSEQPPSPSMPSYVSIHTKLSSQELLGLHTPGSSSIHETPFASTTRQTSQHDSSHSVESSPANDFLGKLIATFRLEADEHLKAMVSGLLALEKATSRDEQQPLLETIFREAHSLKGGITCCRPHGRGSCVPST